MSPTQSAEEEAAVALLMLAEGPGVQEEFDLADEEYHPVQSPLYSAGSSNIQVQNRSEETCIFFLSVLVLYFLVDLLIRPAGI